MAQQIGHTADIVGGDQAAGGVGGRNQDHHFGAIREPGFERVQIEGEAAILDQRNRHGRRAQEIDHGFVDGESGIGIRPLHRPAPAERSS